MKRISKNIFLLTRLKRYTSTNNLKLFFNAQIMSHLNYASTIYDGCSRDIFLQLNSLHRRAAKHLIKDATLTTDEKLRALNILPLEKHFQFNKTLLIHKVYNERTPSYLNTLIVKATERYDSKNLILPNTRIDLYKASFSFSGALAWNNLPDSLKTISSTNVFKRQVFSLFLNGIL